MKKTVLLLCLITLFLAGCGGIIDMRKISVEPKISTENMKKSSLKAGLLLDDKFTGYKYVFETGKQIFLMANVKGEIEIGKNLSQALYGIVSSKFGNVAIVNDVREIHNVDIYFVPRIKSFTYSPPYTGMSSHAATVELETEIFDGNGRLVGSFSIKQFGSRNMFNQFVMQTNYEMAHGAVNEAIDNLLNEFSRKLDELY
ncbi:MAG: hypothetical protein NT140_13170 [Deltaproteobacteria bacterium]|nr:hypothetical protein [Deltaproteobacteria bacterium]